MTDRKGRFWIGRLVVVLLALLVADLLVLGKLFPLLARREHAGALPVTSAGQLSARAPGNGIFLPTANPNKPYSTRTPTPTITPWLVVPPAQAAPVSARLLGTSTPEQLVSEAALPVTRASVTEPAPTETAPMTPAPMPPALQPGLLPASTPRLNGPSVTAPTPTPSAAVSPAPAIETPPAVESSDASATATPVPDPGAPAESASATATDAPTPESTQTPEPTATANPPPFAPGDEAQFLEYILGQYSTLGGQTLAIDSVDFALAPAGWLAVELEFDASVGRDALAAGAAAVDDYVRRLLADTKVYAAGEPCEARVIGQFNTLNLEECSLNPDRCSIGGFVSEEEGWSVLWTYSRATFDGNSDDIEPWTPPQ